MPGRIPTTLFLVLLAACAAPPTQVDFDADTGFVAYRSGRPSAGDLAALCAAGVEEVAVLDGTARGVECRLREEVCPGLRVVYDGEQDADVPVSEGFLAGFDGWVERARREGRGIAWRCRHGWHRAGRLTAWYRMRFQAWGREAAVMEMNLLGRFMWRHPGLGEQVEAMADRLGGKGCSVGAERCVREGGWEEVAAAGGFEGDVCDQVRMAR